MNKISVENAEKLSPQELIELIINNVPHTSIRNCLSNLESVEPDEEEPSFPKISINGSSEPKPVVKPTSEAGPSDPSRGSLNKLREDCKKNPVLIVSENTKLPGKDGLYTIYYTKKSDGSFIKSFKKTSEFSVKTCKNLGEITDDICKSFYDWIKNEISKDPKKRSAVKKVVDDYLSENITLFNSNCKEFKEAMNLLEPPKESSNENIEDLVRRVGEQSGVLIFPKFIPASVSGGKDLVRLFAPFKKDDIFIWDERDVTLEYIRDKVSKTKKQPIGSEKYKKYEEAFNRIDKDTKFYRNLVKTAKNNSKKLGVDVYPFLLI